jgi:hypothetical protein
MPQPARLTKAQAMDALGITSDGKLAKAVGNISRQGVQKWARDELIPVDKQLALHQRFPRKVPMPAV